jgi:hypothetical protein
VIKIADSFAKQAKDFDPDVIEAFDEIVHVTLSRHTDAVDPCKQLKNPTPGRLPSRLVALVWYGLVVSGSLLAESPLGH